MSENGQLRDDELRPIAGGGRLAPQAAAAWNALAALVFARTGVKIASNGPDSSYRSLERQRYWRSWWCSRGKCGNAAAPGTSNHGWGLAVDTDYRYLIEKYGGQFGWRAACSDAPWESWHWRWCGGWAGKDPGPSYTMADAELQRLRKVQKRARAARDLVPPRLDRVIAPLNKAYNEARRKARERSG